jgi:hypothetical protein
MRVGHRAAGDDGPQSSHVPGLGFGTERPGIVSENRVNWREGDATVTHVPGFEGSHLSSKGVHMRPKNDDP